MGLYTITSNSDWETIAAMNLSRNDMIILGSDLTFTSQPSVITLPEKTVFHGGMHKITLNFDNISGLFYIFGGTIEFITTNASDKNVSDYEGLYVKFDAINEQYGDFECCASEQANLGLESGGICGSNFGKLGKKNMSEFKRCGSNVNLLGEGSGGIIGSHGKNIKLLYSCFLGALNNVNTGGLLGKNAESDVDIDICFIDLNINSNSSSAYIASLNENASNIKISQSILFGTINGTGSGGFIGKMGDNNNVTIENCYVTSNILNGGGFIGEFKIGTSNTVNIENCYQQYSISGGAGAIIGISNGGTCNIINCVVSSSQFISTGSVPVITSGNDHSTDLSTIEDGSLPMQWPNNKWQAVSGSNQYPILKEFTNPSNWNGMYDEYTDIPAMRDPIEPPSNMFKKGNRIRSKSNNMNVGTITRSQISGVSNGLIIYWADDTKRAYYGLTGIADFELL
jgi:hypothetical protein